MTRKGTFFWIMAILFRVKFVRFWMGCIPGFYKLKHVLKDDNVLSFILHVFHHEITKWF